MFVTRLLFSRPLTNSRQSHNLFRLWIFDDLILLIKCDTFINLNRIGIVQWFRLYYFPWIHIWKEEQTLWRIITKEKIRNGGEEKIWVSFLNFVNHNLLLWKYQILIFWIFHSESVCIQNKWPNKFCFL